MTLDLDDVIVVGNDTGGALSQLLLSESDERVAGLVLSSCNSFDRFVPPLFKPFRSFAELPGAIAVGIQPLRFRAFRRLPFVFGRIAKYPIPDEITDAWLEPVHHRPPYSRKRPEVRARDRLSGSAEGGRAPAGFPQPVLLLWAREDRLFPFAFAERWMTVFPNARLVPVTDSYTYIAEDQPEFVSREIATFAREVYALSPAVDAKPASCRSSDAPRRTGSVAPPLTSWPTDERCGATSSLISRPTPIRTGGYTGDRAGAHQ